MMASITPCCRRPDTARRGAAWVRLAGLLLACWLAMVPGVGGADDSAVNKAVLRATPQGYVLDAEVAIALNPTLENALSKGINLHFLLELEVTRPGSWYWFDDDIAEPVRKLRIYYHLLLRRYVVESGYVTRTAATLPEALAMLGRINDWQVIDRGALKTGRRYEARLRLRLDKEQLPKPLSIGGVSNEQWELATPWHKWSFDAPPIPVNPPPVSP